MARFEFSRMALRLLPVRFTEMESGSTLGNELIPVFSSLDYSDFAGMLAAMAGAKHDEITIFFQRGHNGEIVRMVAGTDLIHERAIRLVVVVGLPLGACKVCDKGYNYCFVPEFHCCNQDEIITGFKPRAGPIQRPPRGVV